MSNGWGFSQRGGGFGWLQIQDLFEGLSEMHRLGIAHRDIQSKNVMVGMRTAAGGREPARRARARAGLCMPMSESVYVYVCECECEQEGEEICGDGAVLRCAVQGHGEGGDRASMKRGA